MGLSRLRAPQDHGGLLAVPPLEAAGDLLQTNRSRLREASFQFLGRTLQELRELASEEVRAASKRFFATLGIPFPNQASGPLIATGHQPTLFHPGVWVKNFAIHGLARAHGLTPLHLIVDNDLARNTAIRAPVGPDAQRSVSIPFDAWSGPAPFEELAVQDEELFQRFPKAVAEAMHGCGFEPLLARYWQLVQSLKAKTRLPSKRLAGGRRLLEEQWGCHNLELPLSVVCQFESFAWFALHLLANVEKFHRAHNTDLHEYRRRHGIRSRNHPVPDLIQRDDWWEAPFWIWKAGDRVRRRLFARTTQDKIKLRTEDAVIGSLSLSSWKQIRASEEQLKQADFKVRTRALTTTLFARLFLGDLFVHGIGGAIYDELTDAIIRDFYRFEPPSYLVLSATLHLPLTPVQAPNPSFVDGQLRDLWYNPDRHLDSVQQSDPRIQELVRAKQRWVKAAPQTRAERRQRFDALHDLGYQLRPYVEPQRNALLAQREQTEQAGQALRIRNDREFAFCLYPEAELRTLCERLL